jgi:hypothetical protein
MDLLDWFERLILGLPRPLGPLVTALLPVVAIVAGIGTFLAVRRERRRRATSLGIIAVIALVGTVLWTSVMLRA